LPLLDNDKMMKFLTFTCIININNQKALSKNQEKLRCVCGAYPCIQII